MLKVKVESADPLPCADVTATNGLLAADSPQLMKPPDPGGMDGDEALMETDHDEKPQIVTGEGMVTMVTSPEEAAYTIEEGQAETTEVWY